MVMCCCYAQVKSERCGFVQWLDEEWPQRAQEVILTLWDMVNKCIEKADKNLVDKMARQALKNKVKEQMEVLQAIPCYGTGHKAGRKGFFSSSKVQHIGYQRSGR